MRAMSALTSEDSSPGGGAPTPETTTDAAALRDAEQIVDRVAADEQAAAIAREQLHSAPMSPLAPDATVGPRLQPGEGLLALRRAAVLTQPPEAAVASLPGYGGTL